MDNTNSTLERENGEIVSVGISANVPAGSSEDVKELNIQAAFDCYSPEEQAEITSLSEAINVIEVEKVMSYGSVPLEATFRQCGEFLKKERGSSADQEVIAQVVELSKKANQSYDDFNLVLKEPSFFQKFFLKISKSSKKSRADKIQRSAVTNYKLVTELLNSCQNWIDMLKEAMCDVTDSALSDTEKVALLEKYIIAGKLAEPRIEKELSELKTKYEETGMQKYSKSYKELEEGYNIFKIRMANLEKTRVTFYLSIAQLELTKRSNRNVQISIKTQMDNTITVISQQIRNAVLDAKNREILEAQKSISRLNDELIKEVSTAIGATVQDTEKLLYSGVSTIEASKQAINTVINAYNAIEKTSKEMLPKMEAETSQLGDLLKQIQPLINPVNTDDLSSTKTLNESPSSSNEELGF